MEIFCILQDEKERKNLQHTISILCAEYCGMYGVGEYLLGLAAQTDQELYLDAMDQAAGNGITLAAEEMMRSYKILLKTCIASSCGKLHKRCSRRSRRFGNACARRRGLTVRL